MKTKFWSSLVFLLGAGGYLPIFIGGLHHPSEVNMATYGLWTILTVMMVYSVMVQGRNAAMPLGWLVGNVSMLALATLVSGVTFNLGATEAIALFGIVGVVGAWLTAGQITGKSNPRILFFGSILVDVASFYPQLKQYLLPHEPASDLLIAGWAMFLLSAFCNLVWVEGFFQKLRFHYRQSQYRGMLLTMEASLLSMENIFLIGVTILVMLH